ncbi:MAG: hypothetical protein ACRD2L_00140, partial [Terriglobia bacterium]
MGSETPNDLPWLTAWDGRMIDHLLPIAERRKPPRLQMLFFANTFPLAFHYAHALRKTGKQPKDYIRLGEWKEYDNGDNGEVMHYTNEATHKAGQTHIGVTVFDPQWAFVPLTLATSRIWKYLGPVRRGGAEKAVQPRDLSTFLVAAKEAGFDAMWIYAELPDLGAHLKHLVEDCFPDPTIFAVKRDSRPSEVTLPVFNAANSHQSILRLFVYGGSLSSYLLRKCNRYLPLALSNGAQSGDARMETLVSCPEEW